MTVRLYQSSDPSAPVLTGQAGSLVALLDAILVNGYGAKTAAGWTKPFSTTNKGAYLQNLTGANNASGMYFYVDDTAPTTAKEARVCGFETMSAITPTGTGQFPTSAQSAIGVGTLVVRKSATADATARPWICVANGQTIQLFVNTGDITVPSAAYYPLIFGDFKSYKAADQYAVGILGRIGENNASANIDPLHGIGVHDTVANVWNTSSIMFGHFVARHWTGVGGSKAVGKFVNQMLYGSMNTGAAGSTWPDGGWNANNQTVWPGNVYMALGRSGAGAALTYPNGPDSSLWLSPIWINHDQGVRGYYTGLWCPLHNLPISHGDTYTVAGGNLNGKSMLAVNIPGYIGSANDVAQVHVETSDTWT